MRSLAIRKGAPDSSFRRRFAHSNRRARFAARGADSVTRRVHKEIRFDAKRGKRRSLLSFIVLNVGSDNFHFHLPTREELGKRGVFRGTSDAFLRPEDRDFGEALSKVFDDWNGWIPSLGLNVEKSFAYFVTPPRVGSTCKRWCMLFRWMGRKDDLDLGLWMAGSPLLPGGAPGLRPGSS